jgi:glycosyltransferase involved in cell wall biosynthesis
MSGAVVAVSDELASIWKAKTGSPHKIRTIINDVNVDRFQPIADSTGIAGNKALYGLPVSGKIIGTVGRLERIKNQAMLIRAFAELCRRHSQDAHLAIVGIGDEETALKALAESLAISHRIFFLGMQHEMERIYPLLDVFALPSLHEGTCLSLLEAQSCGIPVVATDVGGNSAILSDGQSGFLCPSQDVESMASLLLKLIQDDLLRSRMGAFARQFVVARHERNSMREQYFQLYEEMLAAKSRKGHSSQKRGQAMESRRPQ